MHGEILCCVGHRWLRFKQGRKERAGDLRDVKMEGRADQAGPVPMPLPMSTGPFPCPCPCPCPAADLAWPFWNSAQLSTFRSCQTRTIEYHQYQHRQRQHLISVPNPAWSTASVLLQRLTASQTNSCLSSASFPPFTKGHSSHRSKRLRRATETESSQFSAILRGRGRFRVWWSCVIAVRAKLLRRLTL